MYRICPLKGKDPLITFLINVKAPTRWICTLCHHLNLYNEWKTLHLPGAREHNAMVKKECPYKRQFKYRFKIVLAPSDYIFTEYGKRFKFRYIFADDVTTKIRRLPSLPRLKRYLKTLKLLLNLDVSLPCTVDEIKEIENKVKEQYLNFIEPKKLDTFTSFPEAWKEIFEIDPQDLLIVSKYIRLYGERKQFGIPFLFPLFDMVGDRYVSLIEAVPNRKFLQDMSERYFKETGRRIRFNYLKIPFKPCKESRIYHVKPFWHLDAWYPHQSTQNKLIRRAIRHRVKKIIQDEYCLDYGIISYKDNKCNLHFGNLKGMNRLEDCKVGFIVGSYTINLDGLLEQFRLFYCREPKTLESRKGEDGRYHYIDEKLENFRCMLEDGEMYQAIHRFRPVLKPTKIYVFGALPKSPYTLEFPIYQVLFVGEKSMVTRDLSKDTPKMVELVTKQVLNKYHVMELNKLTRLVWEKVKNILRVTREEVRRSILNSKELKVEFAGKKWDRLIVRKG